MTTRFGAVVLAAIVAAAILVGCARITGMRAPTRPEARTRPSCSASARAIRATDPDTPIAEYFAAQVEKISGGKLRIQVVLDAAGGDVPDTEARIVRMVRDGRLDLGWIGARAWDELGVTSFQALQAPFLIDSYPLLERVTTGPLAGEMLAGLRARRRRRSRARPRAAPPSGRPQAPVPVARPTSPARGLPTSRRARRIPC